MNNQDLAIKKLKDMLSWSDRIGSDEIHEIQETIKVLEASKVEEKEFYVYQNDFCDSDIWKQICEDVGVNYEEYDTLTLKYVNVTASNQ